MIYTHTHHGIRFEIEGLDYDTTATHDGGLVLHLRGGPVLVRPLAGVHRWARNRAGNDASDLQLGAGDHTIAAGETMFLSRRSPQAAPGVLWDRSSDYWAEPSRSDIAAMVPIVAVRWPRPRAPIFRPPAPGIGPIGQHLRSEPIYLDRVRVGKLPRVIDWAALPNAPTIAQLIRVFRDYHGELFDGWSTDTRTPGLQNPGYGTAWASVVSQALCFLCSTAHVEAKRPLAEAMAQWGLDLAAAFGDGRKHHALGGHMAGRKALIVLAGHLVAGAESLLALNETAAALGATFQEDDAFRPVPERWRHSTPIDWETPQQWTDAQRHFQRNYIDQVVGAQIGTALAVRLMGLSSVMGAAHAETCRWWMDEAARSTIADAYRRNGVHPTFGHDYALGFGAGVCSAAWRQVFG